MDRNINRSVDRQMDIKIGDDDGDYQGGNDVYNVHYEDMWNDKQ